MRILILSDIHSNFRALEAVLDRFGDVDEVWCLGDIVEFGPCPSECIDLVRERCNRVIQGNHDVSLVSPEPKGWARYDRHSVSDDDIAWLDALPESVTPEVDGQSFLLVHGTPADPLDGKLYPLEHSDSGSPARRATGAQAKRAPTATNRTASGPPDPTPPRAAVGVSRPISSSDAFRSALADCAADVVLCGHTHVAMIEPFDGKLVVNTGTIGQPRDRDYRAQCMLYEHGRFRFERVDYDLDALASDYERSPLPDDIKRIWLDYTRRGVVDVHGVQLGPFSQGT